MKQELNLKYKAINNRSITHVAVLGAGVMGAQIAAHFVNAGLQVILFDLASEGDHVNEINKLSISAINKLKKQNPAPFGLLSDSSFITPANYRDDLEKLRGCDLIIEAIAEREEWKIALYNKVTPYLKEEAILASNTSSIGITTLAKALPQSLQARFLGIHFFNPPRYMSLLEMTPHKQTSFEVLDKLEQFFTTRIGKGVIRAKDTPGFVSNRIGVMAMMIVLHHAQGLNLPIELIDELTGVRIGRPKSATFRTMDVVGLDTMALIVKELQMHLPDDPWQEHLQLPQWLTVLIEQGALGAKNGVGIYRKVGKQIEVYDIEQAHYRPIQKDQLDPQLKKILKMPATERFSALIEYQHPQAQFLVNVYCDLFHYCAHHLINIAENARDIDLALRWGYGWEQGPFEIWQSFGWQTVRDYLNSYIRSPQSLSAQSLPEWVFSQKQVHSNAGSWSAYHARMQQRSAHPVYQRQLILPALVGYEDRPKTNIYYEDEVLRLWCIQKHIGIISFKTKMNTLSFDLINSLIHVFDLVEYSNNEERSLQALIFYQEQGPFCAGANLYEILMGAKLNHYEHNSGLLNQLLSTVKKKSFDLFSKLPPLPDNVPPLSDMICRLQNLFMRIKHSTMPIIAVVDGLALGGGCELLLHCDRVVAGYESYIGLVEAGVGILPSGAGTKEMTVRAYEQTLKMGKGALLQPMIHQYFEQIAMAKVSTSAPDARKMGYLRDSDCIVMNRNELLYVAHQQANALIESVYTPPRPFVPVQVMGRSGKATLQVAVTNMLAGGYITKHDEQIAIAIADTMTGGDVADYSEVSHQWLLTLERTHFIELLKTEQTQDRIETMLKTGKPLRN